MNRTTTKMRRLKAPLTAVLAALALSGCAATHVGEDWQCPLAQGTQCTSVAAADPAVKPAADAARLAKRGILAGHGPEEVRTASGTKNRSENCGGGCNPLAWFARLFSGGASANDVGDENTGAGEAPVSGMAGHADTAGPEPGTPDNPASAAADDPAPAAAGTVERGAQTASSTVADAPGDDLRAPETIGRVWIAPHVDAAGVYREGAYVRIVIAPASWKRP